MVLSSISSSCCSYFILSFSAASAASASAFFFLFSVIAIILQVRFSNLEPLGNVSFAFVYNLQTCVAKGSSFLPFLSSSASLSSSSLSSIIALGFLGGNNESDSRAAVTAGGVFGDKAAAVLSKAPFFFSSLSWSSGYLLFESDDSKLEFCMTQL